MKQDQTKETITLNGKVGTLEKQGDRWHYLIVRQTDGSHVTSGFRLDRARALDRMLDMLNSGALT
jgi:hypothetical protein